MDADVGLDDVEVARNGVVLGDEMVDARLDAGAREKLQAWLSWQVDRGLTRIADLRAMLLGVYDEPSEPDGVLLAEATGDAEVLARSVPALAEALEDGSRDDILGELLEAERLGRARKGAIAVLESRIAVRDLHRILSASIPELSERLGSGALDDRLDALLDAERDGRARKGAIAVLDERGRWVAEAGILDGTLADLDEWLQTDRDEDLLTFLRDQEAEGKNRKGALALLDARLA